MKMILFKSACTDFIRGMRCPRAATGSQGRKGAVTPEKSDLSRYAPPGNATIGLRETRASLARQWKRAGGMQSEWRGAGRHEIELDQPTSAGMKSRRE